MFILYGLATCDTVKKARYWLNTQKIEYQFYDIRRNGLTLELLQQFALKLDDWHMLVNRKSMTWKKLSATQQLLCAEIEMALPLIVENPTLMKRPILESESILILGFDAKIYEGTLL